MASMVACKIFSVSISSTVALAMHQASAYSRTAKARPSRLAGLSFLESSRPLMGRAGSRMTAAAKTGRSEEHTSELQSLMRISYAVFCLKKKKQEYKNKTHEFNKTS